MRYELAESSLVVRMHAFLHKATGRSDRVTGWFEADEDDPTSGQVAGEASVAVDDFSFSNPVLARMAKQWIRESKSAVLTFALEDAVNNADSATISGILTIAGISHSISANAAVVSKGSTVTVTGTWSMSQKAFGLKAPPGVKDNVDIDFTLVGEALVGQP